MRSETFGNGLSDFHKVTTTMLRKIIPKGNPKSILYRDYKSFDPNKFNEELNSKMKNEKLQLYNISRYSLKRSKQFSAY